MTQKTAILIFSRTAGGESSAKQFLPDQKRNYRIAHSLLKHVKEISTQTDRPFFLFDENMQMGNTFGERFSNAFEYVFDQGYENVIAIGSDSPGLTLQKLNDAIFQVENHSFVLGPNFHEGVYLVGLNSGHFKRRLFENLPWQTSSLNRAFEIYASEVGQKIEYLERIVDINTESDLFTFLESSPLKDRIYYLIFSVVFPSTTIHKTKFRSGFLSRIIHASALRGPPTDYISYN